jgi:hypothetical protein
MEESLKEAKKEELTSMPEQKEEQPSALSLAFIIYEQDEACYAAYALPKRAWKICDEVTARKKTDGEGKMVTMFTDSTHGRGFAISEEDLEEINKKRLDIGKKIHNAIQKLHASFWLIYFLYSQTPFCRQGGASRVTRADFF